MQIVLLLADCWGQMKLSSRFGTSDTNKGKPRRGLMSECPGKGSQVGTSVSDKIREPFVGVLMLKHIPSLKASRCRYQTRETKPLVALGCVDGV